MVPERANGRVGREGAGRSPYRTGNGPRRYGNGHGWRGPQGAPPSTPPEHSHRNASPLSSPRRKRNPAGQPHVIPEWERPFRAGGLTVRPHTMTMLRARERSPHLMCSLPESGGLHAHSPTPERASGLPRRAVLASMAAALPLAGLPSTACAATPPATSRGAGPLPGGGDLGENVLVFDPATPGIQDKLDEIFRKQEKAQFGTDRHALFFKPGTYDGLNAQLGFYTSIAGLGLSPDDTTINGDVTVDAGWFDGNATQNFWRSAENLALKPVSGTNRWAVAQAAPFRRMHVKGGLNLAPDGDGWASGGYLADCRVDGTVEPRSQQQWYTRDSALGGWQGAVWNMVFSGVEGAPAQSFPDPPFTTLDHTPVSREKPFLYLDGDAYKVFVPEKRTDARGTSWGNGTPWGTSLPLDQFYVAKPDADAATLNAALDQGLHLLLTPGVYHLDRPVEVTRADTVVLGLGYATLIPQNGVTALKVADVDGVRLAGLLLDAGPENSPPCWRSAPRAHRPPMRRIRPRCRTCSSASAAPDPAR